MNTFTADGLSSAAASPRRQSLAMPASPRHRAIPSRIPSYSDVDPRTNVVHGFSPPSAGLPTLAESSHPDSGRQALPPLSLHATNYKLAHLSPQLSTPVDQSFPSQPFPPSANGTDSPRFLPSSPRGPQQAEFPPRSRRNSAAIVSISLSSRSRSRTPRGQSAQLPASGQGTPSKGSSSVTPRADDTPLKNEVYVQMGGDAWAPGVDEFDDWQPTGGMLLGSDEEVVEDDDQKNWAIDDDDEDRLVNDVLKPGMLFGEGLEFQGEVVAPAVGRLSGDSSDEGMPLRRGGSEAPKALRGMPGVHHHGRDRKAYEVVRQLGSGSYAVVYLVKERGGRKREYALKCLSKQDLEPEQIETQLFEATIHLSLPIHKNIVTLHQTLQTKKWLFLMLELCPGEDLFYWLEKSRDASPPPANNHLPDERSAPMSSSKFSSSSIPFSSSQLFSGFNSHLGSSFSNSPRAFSPSTAASPASLLFAHNNNHGSPHHFAPSMTPPTPSLLSSFSANTLLSTRRLRLIASMFGQMCEAVAVCHDAGVSHRDIKPENFICCDSIELETAVDGDNDFGPQAKRKVVVKLTDFGLATTEEESGDVECGSKPYMSYECRNNLGPTYYPPAADVWSLGIVLINMLFHRNPWKDPTEGDMNFDNFLRDPTAFLLTKFTGIGREVATYLACHVLCTEVEDRVTARDFGKWVKALPEMIAGRKAVRDLKMARIETKTSSNKPNAADQGLFAKSPVQGSAETFRKTSTSALTSSAPMLSHLPPPGGLSHHASTMPTPDLIDGDDADGDEMKSATTVDEQPTPADTNSYPSPDGTRNESPTKGADPDTDDTRSLSTHKRRKRGVRKGKAAQAALAAAAAGDSVPQEERDEMLKELAQASQSLARHLSKTSRPGSEIDPTDTVEFPLLGTTPSQAAAAKKSKWKDMMKLNSANPELAALARRVAERDGQSGGNWSAPAELQHSATKRLSSSAVRPAYKQTATVSSSGISSTFSAFDPVSTPVTSASGGAEEDDWRARAVGESKDRERKDEDKERARKAQAAAKALAAGMEPMGAFGANRSMIPGNPGHPRSGQHPPRPAHPHANLSSHISYRLHTIDDEDARVDAAPRIHSKAQKITSTTTTMGPALPSKPDYRHDRHTTDAAVSVETASTQPTMSSYSSGFSSTVGPPSLGRDVRPSPPAHAAAVDSPHRPKLKGQIQSLAKMLSGLKTKGKD